MDNYGKIFKNNMTRQFVLRPYFPEREKYFEVIKKAKNQSLKQVIINSEIMIEVLYKTLQSQGLILKMTMSENTDLDIKENVKRIISKVREDRLMFTKLKEEIEWAVDSGSIDIESVEVFLKRERFQIFSNGLVIGESIDSFFDEIMKPVLGSYFDV